MDFALDDTQQAVAGLTREILTREPAKDEQWSDDSERRYQAAETNDGR